MEELEKKTRKSSTTKATTEKSGSTKKSTKQPKATTTEKQPKTTKTSVAKKEAKISTAKKEAKTSTVKKEEKEQKVEPTKKATKEPKVATVKKEAKATTSKKEQKTTKANASSKEPKVTNSKKANTTPKNSKTTLEDKTMLKKKVATINEIAENKDSKKTEKINTQKEKNQQKKSNKVENSKEPLKQENKNKGKKYIEISIGLIIAIIIIGILIVLNVKLGMHAYNVTKEKSTLQNQTVNSEAQLDEEVGTILNSKNQIVNQLVEKITLTPSATASMYKIGSFNTSTISNDLKLRIGWANISDERKLRAKQANGDSIVAVEKSSMEESIQNIFGPEVEYRDESFNNTDVTTFIGGSQNPGIINYSNDMYTAKEIETLEENVPLIYQEIQKVVQYDDRTVVHVKTAFINEENGKLVIYKEFNEEFENKLLEIAYEELFNETSFNQYTGEGTVTVNTNNALNSIRNKLNTCTYTFTLDNSTNQYYLKEVNLENSSASI